MCQGTIQIYNKPAAFISCFLPATEKTFRTITPPALKKTEFTYPFQRYITIDAGSV
ncbi:hypothetical protein MmTuc01_2436 [Methanosarcina mazei Tuc01]|uniref:Uncharacterized protein n=1 Tax=Methanosarcina mazei Tuc01 TaxID=1236903 RepID=M1PZH0_METMZ|nr:hypothetical protein MmTuc01_2436 [Methanosarcina mazei Tuc01]